MHRGVLLAVALALVVQPAVATVAATGDAGDGPRVVAVYPDPVDGGDRGEFVVVSLPGPGNWTLTDGETAVRLPANASGVFAVSAAPAVVRNRTDHRVVGARALRLANGGETVVLRRDGREVDRLRYGDATEGAVFRRDEGWRPLGATDLPVVATGGSTARAFVLPDSPAVPVETLRGAERRLLLAGYTLTSERVADALVAAARRGVTVRVLVEGGPVGGLPRREARLLDRLVAAGVDVRAVGGPRARYAHHHAKYAVVDGRALVLTENWKPAGTGGRSSRGWGVVLDDPTAAAALAETFRADAGWRDAVPWTRFRRGRTFERAPPAEGSYPSRIAPRTVAVERTRLLVAPDNAERALVGTLRNATDTVRVVQVSVGGPDGPFAPELVRAARRGVEVRLLLSGAWYVREENRALADRLNERADEEGLPLAVRLADPAGRFEKVHAKGVVVDDERAVVGSLNWNAHAARENREVAVVLDGEAVAGYYAAAFDADWRASGGARLPLGVVGAVVAAAAGALALARRVRFERGAAPLGWRGRR